ncbi:hypothetical protein BCV70DRAFT_25931 [Testicularia cyperi]|uniref:Uncharacterized protein n=1 Tax=Testicularia cyperi TaxID=1882483 RepID=A0A317XMX8_9BASI|nr:hypothetical protein BCV70DRAFT_25931 [Testicularia cyperi]
MGYSARTLQYCTVCSACKSAARPKTKQSVNRETKLGRVVVVHSRKTSARSTWLGRIDRSLSLNFSHSIALVGFAPIAHSLVIVTVCHSPLRPSSHGRTSRVVVSLSSLSLSPDSRDCCVGLAF